MKLSSDQQRLLRALSDADLRYKSELLTAPAIARAQADAKIYAAKAERAALAAQCERAGIPVLRIAREGLRTSSTRTATAAINEGSGK